MFSVYQRRNQADAFIRQRRQSLACQKWKKSKLKLTKRYSCRYVCIERSGRAKRQYDDVSRSFNPHSNRHCRVLPRRKSQIKNKEKAMKYCVRAFTININKKRVQNTTKRANKRSEQAIVPSGFARTTFRKIASPIIGSD